MHSRAYKEGTNLTSKRKVAVSGFVFHLNYWYFVSLFKLSYSHVMWLQYAILSVADILT